MNNPLSLVDPSGYIACMAGDLCMSGGEGNRDDEGKLIKSLDVTSIDHVDMTKDGQVIAVMDNGDNYAINGAFGGGSGTTDGGTGTLAPTADNTGGSGNQGSLNQRGNGLSVCWTDQASGIKQSVSLGETPIRGATSWSQGDKFVSTYTAGALDALFPVTGGTDLQRAEVKNDIMRVAHTVRGSVLFDKALGMATPFETQIIDNNNKMPNSVYPGGPAQVSFGNPPLEWLRSNHQFKPDMVRQVAHELFGHPIDGIGDTGPDHMDNVRRNENPIMMEIYPEQGDRLRYP